MCILSLTTQLHVYISVQHPVVSQLLDSVFNTTEQQEQNLYQTHYHQRYDSFILMTHNYES